MSNNEKTARAVKIATLTNAAFADAKAVADVKLEQEFGVNMIVINMSNNAAKDAATFLAVKNVLASHVNPDFHSDWNGYATEESRYEEASMAFMCNDCVAA